MSTSSNANLKSLLDRLWGDYRSTNPQVGRIHELLAKRGESVVNDHIALRTYGDPRVGLDVLARPFLAGGYRAGEDYTFKEKKLAARHFEHDDPSLPRVFISALDLSAFSDGLRSIVAGIIEQVDAATLARDDLPVIGRPWSLSTHDYQALASESEYAAWVAAFGFRANHFTILVNALKHFETLEQLNSFIKDSGFKLNSSGGEIKGSAQVFLEQSSTLADQVQVDFSNGKLTIPCCYYEFARRHPLPDGKLFGGFVAKSADKIFESTDRLS
jgi:hypothetical protein